MARLFITQREMAFISDIAKEVVHDVNGQEITYFPISELKTLTHEVYNEAVKKVFDNPIIIGALVSANYQEETKVGRFGPDAKYRLDVFVQYRDLVDRGIEICLGDFFSFGSLFYEIANVNVIKNIFGQAEHKVGIKFTGTKVREGQFKAKFFGPTDINDVGDDAIKKKFVQQRGYTENDEGLTGDKRDLHVVTEGPITGPKEISELGALSDDSHNLNSFYDE